MRHWLKSKLFRVSGLDPATIELKIADECRSGGDFLRIVMEAIAKKQNVKRWAECTPDHLLYMSEIKKQIPNALFIHIIRDGRDVALSFAKQGWAYPLPWDRDQNLAVAALYWQWIVRTGRRQGRHLGTDYIEVHFEDLITRPRDVLSKLGEFIGQDLDYDYIQQVGIGSVSEPNSSFLDDSDNAGFSPIGRWKSKLSSRDLLRSEALIGDLLEDLGYPLTSAKQDPSSDTKRMKRTYPLLFDAKFWAKNKTPLGRFVNIDLMEIAPPL